MVAPAMDDIAERYTGRGVSSVFIYVREAHPGERLPHHTSMEVKRSNARAFRDEIGVRRKILVDDLEGSVHQAYRMLSNMTWIIGKGAMVFYKAAWTEPPDVVRALDHILDGLERRATERLIPMYTEQVGWRSQDRDEFRRHLERAGSKAVEDFYG